MNEKTLDISGMSCAGCAATVEKAAGETSGVREASVDLAEEKLRVAIDESFEVDTLIQAIADAGYTAAEQKDEK